MNKSISGILTAKSGYSASLYCVPLVAGRAWHRHGGHQPRRLVDGVEVVCRARPGVGRGWTTLLTVGLAQAGGTQQLTEQEWDVMAGGIGPTVLSMVFRPSRLTNLLILSEVTAQVGVQHLGM